MSLLNFILNLIGLLLWVNWRALAFKERVPYRSTLLHTLRSAEANPERRWRYLAGLLVLLLLRAWLYGQLGSALSWVPAIDLHAIAIPFRADLPWRMTFFSFLSFGGALALFYLWLLLLSVVNRAAPDTQPVQHLVRLHLGPVERWPAFVKFALPPVLALLIWLALHPLFVWHGLLPDGHGAALVAQQGIVLGVASFLSWKFLIIAMLGAQLVNSYVYLGRSPLWDFASLTARHLLQPLAWIPLRVSKVDFAPLLGIALVVAGAHFAEQGLVAVFKRLPF